MCVSSYFLLLTHISYFSHGNIIKYCRRPGLTQWEQELLDAGEDFKVSWESVERMNSYLLEEINKTVGENDTLWHLGDFCFGYKDKYLGVATRFRNQIKCKNIFFIKGNHDRKEIAPLFSSFGDMAEIYWRNQMIVLCHYALAIWPKSHRQSICCFGHSHSGAEEWLDKIMPGRRSIDVGVDNAAKILGTYRPFSFEEIMKIMKNKKGHSIRDHHEQRK